MNVVLIGLLVVAAPGQAPAWDTAEMKQLFGLAQMAGQAPGRQQKELALLQLAARAYRFDPPAAPSIERSAQDLLRHRVPEHPAVKSGQWLTALMRQFYEDASKRAEQLSRFERDRGTRQFLEQMAQESNAAAEYLGGQIQLVVDGMDDAIGALPMVGGDTPTKQGALTLLKGDKLVIENLSRATFVADRPKDDEPRTPRGALKEVYSAYKQYNMQSKMFGEYDSKWRKNGGHIQVAVPATKPALYLNELVRAAVPAGMHTLHVMTMTKKGELREIPIAIADAGLPKRKRKKKAKVLAATCADDITMEDCAKRIVHAKSQGTARFTAP